MSIKSTEIHSHSSDSIFGRRRRSADFTQLGRLTEKEGENLPESCRILSFSRLRNAVEADAFRKRDPVSPRRARARARAQPARRVKTGRGDSEIEPPLGDSEMRSMSNEDGRRQSLLRSGRCTRLTCARTDGRADGRTAARRDTRISHLHKSDRARTRAIGKH